MLAARFISGGKMRRQIGFGLAALVLSWLAEPVAAQETVQDQAALTLLGEELDPDESARYQALLNSSGPEARESLLRLATALPMGDRGAFASWLMARTPAQQQAMFQILPTFSPPDIVKFAAELARRRVDDWDALDLLLDDVPADAARLWLLSPGARETCWQETAVDDDNTIGGCPKYGIGFLSLWNKNYTRVLRGTYARRGDAPYQVQLLRAGKSAASFMTPQQAKADRLKYGIVLEPWLNNHLCGGAYIGDGWVVTAAHCIDREWDSKQASFFEGRKVRLGSRSIVADGVFRSIDAVVRHAGFVSAEQGNDIALLRLAPDQRKVGTVEEIQPVALPTNKTSISASTPLRLSGWGFTGPTTDKSAPRDMLNRLQLAIGRLQVGNVFVRPIEACNSNPNYKAAGYRITNRQLCAGSSEGVDSCRGDSGGPLVAGNVLIGIVSFGPGCGLKDTPGTYADVRAYRSWIDGAKRQAISGRIVNWAP